MAPKSVFAAVIFASLLTSTAALAAEQYRAGEFLGLDLSKAALSPKLLGPMSKFEPVPVHAKADQGSEDAQARAEPKAEPNVVVRKTRVAHLRMTKPRGSGRTTLARRHTESARRPGVRYTDSGLAMPLGRHLRLEAAKELISRAGTGVIRLSQNLRPRVKKTVQGRRFSAPQEVAAQHQQHGQRNERAGRRSDDGEQLIGRESARNALTICPDLALDFVSRADYQAVDRTVSSTPSTKCPFRGIAGYSSRRL